MAEERVPGVSPDKKRRIDAMSAVEMTREVEAGRYSRFNAAARAYMKQRLVELESVDVGEEIERQTWRDRVGVAGVIAAILGVVVAAIAIYFA